MRHANAQRRPLRIAIDGPAGAGKTTLGKALAERFGLRFVNTGLLYRAVAWALQKGYPLNTLQLTLDERGRPVVDGHALPEAELQTRELDRLSSEVARRPEVRARLVELQRSLARRGDGGVVMEGRDIGTVVLPDADVKLFVTAAPEERARRRARERPGASFEQMLKELKERDERDRGFGRLVPAADAIVLDTTGKTPEETVEEAVRLVERALRERSPSVEARERGR